MTGNRHWSAWVQRYEEHGEAYVLVTVLGARGSTPRDTGTKMVVGVDRFEGTIGGGTLEHRALARSRELLQTQQPGQWIENFPLGEKLGQCCGGSTNLLFESFIAQRRDVYLFGAGHVGRALAPLLATLPLHVHWVDSRQKEFPAQVPNGVQLIHSDDPLQCITEAATASYFIIMTHEHPLDYALAEAALRRGDASYIGVIGSETKARRFRLRLEHRGYGSEEVARVHCPIGDRSIPGKHPAEIAVSIASQIIGHYHRAKAQDDLPGPTWKELQAKLGAPDGGILVTTTNGKHNA